MNKESLNRSVVEFCKAQADQHKLDAADAPNKSLHDEHVARAMMAEFIADHFSARSASTDLDSPDVLARAREISPASFQSYDAMIARLCKEGNDLSYAKRLAMDTYGDQIDEALSQASLSLANDRNYSENFDAYSRGYDDAAQWHINQANEAERLAQLDQTQPGRSRYQSIAKRHRSYAAHLRAELSSRRTRAVSEKQALRIKTEAPQKSGAREAEEDGIPIEVQRAFLKKGEVMDDEGW